MNAMLTSEMRVRSFSMSKVLWVGDTLGGNLFLRLVAKSILAEWVDSKLVLARNDGRKLQLI